MPHGYTNLTSLVDGIVVKQYVGVDAEQRFDVEVAALSALLGQLPVPRVVAVDARRLALSLQLLGGLHAQEVVDRAGVTVLRATGGMARRIHAVVVDVGFGPTNSPGALVHGDFGPQNLLVDRHGTTVIGVLDWEFAHVGDPLEDLMWAEWIVRTHHPKQVDHIGEMYSVYGRSWSWTDRQRAMLERCDDLRKSTQGAAGALWTQRLDATSRWAE